jgi:hypothetical protein
MTIIHPTSHVNGPKVSVGLYLGGDRRDKWMHRQPKSYCLPHGWSLSTYKILTAHMDFRWWMLGSLLEGISVQWIRAGSKGDPSRVITPSNRRLSHTLFSFKVASDGQKLHFTLACRFMVAQGMYFTIQVGFESGEGWLCFPHSPCCVT